MILFDCRWRGHLLCAAAVYDAPRGPRLFVWVRHRLFSVRLPGRPREECRIRRHAFRTGIPERRR